jgi:hypothetical protein
MENDKGRAAALILAVALVHGGCGYSLAGRGSFLPEYIRVIGVPLLVNGTQVFEIELLLTEKLRTELIGRGKYKVQPDQVGVDAVLSGEISSVSLQPAAFNADQQATRYNIIVTARLEFRDLKTNAVLWHNPALVFRDEYEVASVGAALDVTLFFGQQSNAVDRVAEEFAKTVVTAILEAF